MLRGIHYYIKLLSDMDLRKDFKFEVRRLHPSSERPVNPRKSDTDFRLGTEARSTSPY
jgi:hypothetical protein